MLSLRKIPLRHYLQSFLLLAFLGTTAFSTRWLEGRKMLFEVLWDPSPIYLFYPADKLVSGALKQGRIALWDPYRGFGAPLILPCGSTLAHPLKFLAFLSGSDWGFELALLFRLIFAGFFAWLLARGLGVGQAGALLSGVGFMFSGYFRQFHNFIDLYVFMFYPLALLFTLRLFRSLRFFDLVICLWLIYLFSTGAHPEAIYFYASYIFLSGLFFILLEAFREKKLKAKNWLARSVLVVVLIVQIHFWNYALVPFAELFVRGWSYHPPGLGTVHFQIQHLVALFTPIFDYWLDLGKYHSELARFTIIPSYLGILLMMLALITIFGLKRLSIFASFFWLQTLLVAGILFGCGGFHLITHLPLINRFQNFRYFQPIFALGISVLAGYGFEHLFRLKRYFLIVFALLLGWLVYHLVIFRGFLLQAPKFFLALGMVLILLLLFCAFLLLQKRFFAFFQQLGLKGVIFLGVILELFAYFIFARPFFGPEAFQIKKPGFVEKNISGLSLQRIYSPVQELLPPNTASLYQLYDLRDRGPLYPVDYFIFLSCLNQWENQEQASSQYIRQGRFYLPLELEKISEQEKDWLFGFLLTRHRLNAKSLLEEKGWKLLLPAPNYFSRAEFELKGKSREAVLLHPPSRAELNFPQEKSGLIFEAGIHLPQDSRTDGVQFLILGKNQLLFSRFLSKKEAEKGWREYQITRRFKKLVLASLPGPKGEPEQDFALFGSLELLKPLPGNYRLIDESGPFLYQRTSSLPRFFSAPAPELLTARKQALEKIKSSGLNLKKWWLSCSEENCPKKDFLNLSSCAKAKIKLEKEDTSQLILDLNYQSAGWLVIIDLYYPGWRAYLDGSEVPLYPANYLFRAVPIPAGRHRLKMVFQPRSFALGIYLNLGSLLFGILLLGLLGIQRKGYF